MQLVAGTVDNHKKPKLAPNINEERTLGGVKMKNAIENSGLEKIKTVGDAILATGGLTRSLENPVQSAARCGLNLKKIALESGHNWAIHVGIHFFG